MSTRADKLLESGPAGQVLYAASLTGKYPAEEFLDELNAQEQARFGKLFERLACTGRIMDESKFKHLEDGLFEFKTPDYRVGAWRSGNRWFLLSGWKKQGQKTRKHDLDRIRAFRDIIQTRVTDNG